ncbi:MAG: MerR family transcriptional regulator, partial [Imperialibacter sp.]
MPYKEKEIEKKYYTIGEVADMMDVATSLIR